MLILSLESSAKPASVAVYETDSGGLLLGQYYRNNGLSHSRTLLTMAEALMKNLGIKPADIDLFAVAGGPGSFTGVRIGVSAVKGLAFGTDKPVCGVSTLEAMAYQTASTDTLICPVMDARRDQVYNALFKREDDTLVRLREDRAISIADLAADLKNFDLPFMPLGDGTDLFLSKINDDSGLRIVLPCPGIKYQTAYGVSLAALHTEPVTAAQLEPAYLRPSQAERERMSRK